MFRLVGKWASERQKRRATWRAKERKWEDIEVLMEVWWRRHEGKEAAAVMICNFQHVWSTCTPSDIWFNPNNMSHSASVALPLIYEREKKEVRRGNEKMQREMMWRITGTRRRDQQCVKTIGKWKTERGGRHLYMRQEIDWKHHPMFPRMEALCVCSPKHQVCWNVQERYVTVFIPNTVGTAE